MKKTQVKNNFKSIKTFTDLPNYEEDTMQFIASGIACHALCLLDHVGILKILLNKGKFNTKLLKQYNNPNLIHTALISLSGAKILYWNENEYYLSTFGKHVLKKIPFITLPLTGYRKLFEKQLQLLKNPNNFKFSDIDFASIALSSVEFGKEDLEPLLIKVFKNFYKKGTICDLGCGTAEKLVNICKITKAPGLGIEQSQEVINESKQFTKNYPEIEVIKGSIKNLKGVWEDVTTSLISFVLHDIDSEKNCEKILRSYKKNFPRMQSLIIIDIVSLSKSIPSIMPGFDYVHGLQGILPRTYEKTIEIFKNANYKILDEIRVPNMPNTFIWVLQ